MDLLIKNIGWEGETRDVRISGRTSNKKEYTIDFSGHFLYRGLVNSHDHLEMNLYPRLGTPPYNNYTEWSKDIYKPNESPLKEIEKTDREYRLIWGGLKNLISGATTVIHHNPWKGMRSFPVNVPDINWAHSLAFEKNLPKKIDVNKPFVIHAAEGIDDFSRNEIHRLDELGLIKENTTIVHGTACGPGEWTLLELRKATLAWCPASNLYMFNKTSLPRKLNVVLGTDSTLTGSPTLLHEMKIASNYISRQEIFKMTRSHTDFFIAPIINSDPIENLFSIEPKDIKMVIVNGEVRMQDESTGLPPLKNSFSVQGVKKQTDINVQKLRSYFEKKIGGKILEANPLWNMIS